MSRGIFSGEDIVLIPASAIPSLTQLSTPLEWNDRRMSTVNVCMHVNFINSRPIGGKTFMSLTDFWSMPNTVTGQNGIGQNGTDKMVAISIDSSST